VSGRKPFDILFQDNHLLAVAKPAGVPVQGDESGDLSLLEMVREHRKSAENKPGNVFVGLVHRLDRAVSGVVVFAKTSKAASRLSEQFRNRTVEKTYLAAVEIKKPLREHSGTWRHHLLKDERSNLVRIVGEGKGLEAMTDWKLLDAKNETALLELRPMTGRPHQLRVQCSAAGLPIVGDKRYGAKTLFPDGIALHAKSLEFDHPTTKVRIKVGCAMPEDWREVAIDVHKGCKR
jgi:23S rRNA pseudouridine1911/1915/1917 synthase